MPLTLVKQNEKDKIIKIIAGKEEKQHLLDLGFIEGEQINIISNNGGNVILEIKGTKLAITENMAKKIIVQPL